MDSSALVLTNKQSFKYTGRSLKKECSERRNSLNELGIQTFFTSERVVISTQQELPAQRLILYMAYCFANLNYNLRLLLKPHSISPECDNPMRRWGEMLEPSGSGKVLSLFFCSLFSSLCLLETSSHDMRCPSPYLQPKEKSN